MIKRRGTYLLFSGWAQSQAMLHLLQGAKRTKFWWWWWFLLQNFQLPPTNKFSNWWFCPCQECCNIWCLMILVVFSPTTNQLLPTINSLTGDSFGQECWNILQHRDWSNDQHKSHFEVGNDRFNITSFLANIMFHIITHAIEFTL